MPTPAHTLRTETIEAEFLLTPHLLGVSLRHDGDELLRAVSDVPRSARLGEPCGIPLLHPWANRLARPEYHAAGKHVVFDKHAPVLRRDAHGLPLHGVPWSMLRAVEEARESHSCSVRIDWDDEQLLAVFPYRHSLRVEMSVQHSTITINTTLMATGRDAVPVSFGYHPYFGLPGSPRDVWRLRMPEREQLQLDHQGLPSGASTILSADEVVLGDRSLDDAFALVGARSEVSISDDVRRITVRCMEGYTHLQLYAPAGQEFICLEPMTAPVNALCAGSGLRTVAPGDQFRATFCIAVDKA